MLEYCGETCGAPLLDDARPSALRLTLAVTTQSVVATEKTILVVEDEDAVRFLAERLLRLAGTGDAHRGVAPADADLVPLGLH